MWGGYRSVTWRRSTPPGPFLSKFSSCCTLAARSSWHSLSLLASWASRPPNLLSPSDYMTELAIPQNRSSCIIMQCIFSRNLLPCKTQMVKCGKFDYAFDYLTQHTTYDTKKIHLESCDLIWFVYSRCMSRLFYVTGAEKTSANYTHVHPRSDMIKCPLPSPKMQDVMNCPLGCHSKAQASISNVFLS